MNIPYGYDRNSETYIKLIRDRLADHNVDPDARLVAVKDWRKTEHQRDLYRSSASKFMFDWLLEQSKPVPAIDVVHYACINWHSKLNGLMSPYNGALALISAMQRAAIIVAKEPEPAQFAMELVQDFVPPRGFAEVLAEWGLGMPGTTAAEVMAQHGPSRFEELMARMDRLEAKLDRLLEVWK